MTLNCVYPALLPLRLGLLTQAMRAVTSQQTLCFAPNAPAGGAEALIPGGALLVAASFPKAGHVPTLALLQGLHPAQQV